MSRTSIALVEAWYRGDRWLHLLRPLEWLFRIVLWCRKRFYHLGLLPVYRAPVPVVVVGNLTIGGAGKTPVVIALVQALQERGIQAGVVSRGYGSVLRGQVLPVSTNSNTAECGDEPLLIVQRTTCPCVVGPSRVEAVKTLLEMSAVDIIICDDGLQHYALARDLEIVVYDAHSAFGNGRCLPEGPLREPLARLAQADFVLARGSDNQAQGVQYHCEALVNVNSGAEVAAQPGELGQAVHAVAGLGRPALFLQMLAQLGFEPEPHLFPDHHDFVADDLAGLQNLPVIMTEKDAVKCRGLVGDDAWYLKISAAIPADVESAVHALVEQRPQH